MTCSPRVHFKRPVQQPRRNSSRSLHIAVLPRPLLRAQKAVGVEVDVVVDEGADEEVAVVVAGVHAEVERLAGGLAGLAQRVWAELVDVADEEGVVGADVDEDGVEGRRLRPCAHEFGRVVRATGVDRAQVPLEGCGAPRDGGRMANRREGRHARVPVRVLPRERQRPVAAHRVSRDAGAAARDDLGHGRLEHLGELGRDVRFHVVVRRPRRFGGVEVEPRPRPEVVSIVFAGKARAARRGVRRDERDLSRRRAPRRAGFLRKVLVRAG
mmetsp:Transcript_21101/g.84125  ORF Transcript_21101/g.84125 Transcript_21101/m.84125 type:complete len:269 (+) Transcript_21101:116-922(+)